MDVRSSFLNGELKEEVYVEQLEGFQLLEEKYFFRKLKKELYDFNPDPREWYYRLDAYLHEQSLSKCSSNSNLYIKKEGGNMLILMVYVYVIIF